MDDPMCPVCGHDVEDKTYACIQDGVSYELCCTKCKEIFLAGPRKYINYCEQPKEEEK